MKLSTLKEWFQQRARNSKRARTTKLYFIDGSSPVRFLIAGFASDPIAHAEELHIDVGPYVVYSFVRDDTLKPEKPFLGLRLEPKSLVTRKFQTHRRNVLKLTEADGRLHLAEYFKAAWDLEDAPRAPPARSPGR